MEITNELLAAYAEGNVSESERKAVRQYLINHPNQLETVMMMMDEDYDVQLNDDAHAVQSQRFDAEMNNLLDEVNIQRNKSVPLSRSVLPMTAMAAQNNVDNLCAIRSEGYAMRRLGIRVSDDELIRQAEEKELIKPQGKALYNIGKLSGEQGLNVAHRYNCSLDEISKALNNGDVVLVVVDNEELKSNEPAKDTVTIYFIGQNSNKEDVYKIVKREYDTEKDGRVCAERKPLHMGWQRTEGRSTFPSFAPTPISAAQG